MRAYLLHVDKVSRQYELVGDVACEFTSSAYMMLEDIIVKHAYLENNVKLEGHTDICNLVSIDKHQYKSSEHVEKLLSKINPVRVHSEVEAFITVSVALKKLSRAFEEYAIICCNYFNFVNFSDIERYLKEQANVHDIKVSCQSLRFCANLDGGVVTFHIMHTYNNECKEVYKLTDLETQDLAEVTNKCDGLRHKNCNIQIRTSKKMIRLISAIISKDTVAEVKELLKLVEDGRTILTDTKLRIINLEN